ncbi:MAG: D-alanyl-D-alanine carboxypeptidase [Ruminococcaceae bacterium]|nr:D-alanyl-D-alanine carboxypeptidase [Oscillospiraceae bacterium]
MKIIIGILLVFAVIIPIFTYSFSLNAEASLPVVSAESSVLMRSDNCEVIWSKGKDMPLPMASTTKIMTAIVTIENADIDKTVKIPAKACGIEGSSAYLYEGEEMTRRDLLYALMLQSANDAAVALAMTVSDSVEDFVKLMNAKAKELDLKNTHFANPHGLDADDHFSSAYDLGVIMAYAMRNETFREITSSYKYTAGEHLFVNHNKLLKNYDGCIGGKTGFTKRCGRCLVSVAERDGVELICVTLNAPNDWKDHSDLFDYGFDQYERVLLVAPAQYFYSINVINGTDNTVNAEAAPLSVIMKKGSAEHLKVVCELDRFYYADITYGELLGHLVFYSEGKEIARSQITAQSSIKEIKYKNWWQKLLSLFIKDV